MPESKSIFDELIVMLEKVKHTKDIPDDLLNEMINATLMTGIVIAEAKGLNEVEALQGIRTLFIKHIDEAIYETLKEQSKAIRKK